MSSVEHEIIDCHIHPVVDGDTNVCWFHSAGSFAMQIDDLRRLGISKACGSVIELKKAASFDDVRCLNEKAMRLRDRYPDFFIPGFQIHPHYPEESLAEVERLVLGEGARWAGELVGYITGYGEEYATDAALAVMRRLAELCVPVNIHFGADARVIEKLCAAVPELKVVAAHLPSAKKELAEKLDIMRRFANLYYDLSGSASVSRYGIVRRCTGELGAKRFLYGSDYPINSPGAILGAIRYEQLEPQDQADILAGNFKRLISGF